MPCKFLERMTDWFKKGSPKNRRTFEPRVIPRDQHPISRKQVSRAALDVLYGLHKAGFEAYLVGGCLRDILCGREPKDFDVSTNATPEQVNRLFKRSRIIGRRFQIVHVRFGREVIEVSTFRAMNREDNPDRDQHHAHEETGLVLRDNTWGSIEEDALRRDFTINALYYNIADFALYDFVGSPQILCRFRDFDRLFSEVPSANNGITFCCGTRYESGEDVLKGIEHFGKKKQLFHVHFRNVHGTIPGSDWYEETIPDAGDLSMFRVAKALHDVGYEGAIDYDHLMKLTTDEKMRLFGEVKQSVGDKGVIIAGTGTYSTAESIELSQEGRKRDISRGLFRPSSWDTYCYQRPGDHQRH